MAVIGLINYGAGNFTSVRDALEYLLEDQHPEGKWGNWEEYREQIGDLVDVGLYLHTTTVAIRALSIAFHFRER